MYYLSVPVYHVDNSKNNQDFISGTNFPESTEDGEWAGRGLYFWDNRGNTKYWLEHRKYEPTICKALLRLPESQLLDLTDPYSIKGFEDTVELLQELHLISEKVDFSKKGAIINATYKALAKLVQRGSMIAQLTNLDIFFAVKVIGEYPKISGTTLFDESKGKDPHFTMKAKTIYAVRSQELLTKRIMIKEDQL